MRIGTILPGSLLNAKVCLGHILRKSNTYPINEWLGDKYAYSLPRELSRETGGSRGGCPNWYRASCRGFQPIDSKQGKRQKHLLGGEHRMQLRAVKSLASFGGEYKTRCGPQAQRQASHIPKGLSSPSHRRLPARLVQLYPIN